MSDLAEAFALAGHDVTVFTTSAGVAQAELRRDRGINVLRVPTAKQRGIGLVRRAVSEIVMPIALWRGSRRCAIPVGSFAALIWYSPSIFLAPFVYWLKKRSGARAYLILRDIFPQWAVDAGVMRRGLSYYFFRLFERFQYRVADVVGVQSPANLHHVQKDIARREQVEVLYNWAEFGREAPSATKLIDQHGLAGKRILIYGGNMGVAQDVDNLLRLAERIRDHEDLSLVLVGAGSEVGRVKQAVAQKNLVNTTVLDEVDPEEFRSILRRSHVGLITLDRRLTTHNIPGKLLAYLEAGLPVVASVNPGNDLMTMLEESGAGVALVNGQDAEFAQSAVRLVRDPGRCAEMSSRARALARDRFSVASVVEQLTLAIAKDIDVAESRTSGAKTIAHKRARQ
jgi:glycosyltransferase involved in cell wall biosynthesis